MLIKRQSKKAYRPTELRIGYQMHLAMLAVAVVCVDHGIVFLIECLMNLDIQVLSDCIVIIV